jgi:hypothetical protein
MPILPEFEKKGSQRDISTAAWFVQSILNLIGPNFAILVCTKQKKGGVLRNAMCFLG